MDVANDLTASSYIKTRAFGIAVGAVILRSAATAGGRAAPVVTDFRVAFAVLAVAMVLASLRVLVLPVDAGAAVSGAGLARARR